MIEFRWLDAPLMIATEPLPDGISASIPRKKILQFREAHCSGLDDDGVPHYHGQWSDWQNVPTVKYEDLK